MGRDNYQPFGKKPLSLRQAQGPGVKDEVPSKSGNP